MIHLLAITLVALVFFLLGMEISEYKTQKRQLHQLEIEEKKTELISSKLYNEKQRRELKSGK